MNTHLRRLPNPYVVGNQPPLTKRSVVLWLDLLGFQEQTRSLKTTARANSFLIGLRHALGRAYDHLDTHFMSETATVAPWQVKTFTDNIVIGYPISGDGDNDLSMAFTHAALVQVTLISEGFFVRGGVSIAELYMDEDIVFGAGLIEAHDAENMLARDPRVVLAPSAVKAVDEYRAAHAARGLADVSPYRLVVLEDSDGQVFLSYLDTMWENVDSKDPEDREMLHRMMTAHRAQTVRCLKQHAGNPRVWSKYFWVANYHNYFCREDMAERERYLIDLTGLQPRPRRLTDPSPRAPTDDEGQG